MSKTNYLSISALLIVTIVATTTSFNWAMIAISTFFLAYVSKGSRRHNQNQTSSKNNQVQN
jgi:hypothetical protein